MASDTLTGNAIVSAMSSERATAESVARPLWRRAVAPLASLRLTVTLFGLAIFIILAGTGAQVHKDIWQVISQYFRTPLAWVELNDLLPLAFIRNVQLEPWIGFYFPGGWLIGALMAVNLVAAHLTRFKIQATGGRLFAGLAVIGVGAYLTVLVIGSGDAIDGLRGVAPIEWTTLWNLILVGLAAIWVAMAYALWQLPRGRTVERWTLIVAGALLGATLAYFVIGGESARLGNESMRILWQLTQGGLAGVVLLAGCGLVFARRAGIVLIHGGVGLLMFGELWVGLEHVEAQMHIREGEVVNFVQDIRSLELAVIDSADKEKDRVAAIPESLLVGREHSAGFESLVRRLFDSETSDRVVRDEQLPFDVKVARFYRNSAMKRIESKDENPASAGAGLRMLAVEREQVSGTDPNQMNWPAAYVEFYKKGTDELLGTHLVSLAQWNENAPEKVTVGDKTYDVFLRFKRIYKDYAIQLMDFRFDRYVGTTTAKNYSSDVRIINKAAGDDREVKIWMNNPLRYAGETFYQQSFVLDPITKQEIGTVLQVVTNSGWMIPYVACMLVATGLLGHFSLTLLRFLRGRAVQAASEFERLAAAPALASRRVHPGGPASDVAPASKSARHSTPPLAELQQTSWLTTVGRWLPLAACAFVALWAAGQAFKAFTGRAGGDPQGRFDLDQFGRLPVIYEGRVKPLDTLARNSLRIISDRETFIDENGDRQPAIRWLLDVISDTRAASRHEVFRVRNLELLSLLDLKRKKGYRYSFADLKPKFEEIEKQGDQARAIKALERSVFQKKAIDLHEHLTLYVALHESFHSEPIEGETGGNEAQFLIEAAARQGQLSRGMVPLAVPLAAASEKWEPLASATARAELKAIANRRQVESPEDLAASIGTDATEAMAAIERQALSPEQSERLQTLQQLLSPPSLARAIALILGANSLNADVHPWTPALANVLAAYRGNKAEDFNRAVEKYADLVDRDAPADVDHARLDFESFFNGFAPFSICQYVYLAVFALAALSWFGWSGPLGRTALWLTAATLVLHTIAIVARVYISGRPPITNLYSTAIAIGWACVLLGLIFEGVYRLGVGIVVAGKAGFLNLLIADGLASRGDTFVVMQAVLDTQFWLSTHVVAMNFGYATSFLAGLLGVVYIVMGLVAKDADAQTGKQLARMIYGATCFAIFFSFVGTVLGGLWADDSWGRFWGWDPKENGALIIVLWNAIVLHSRWGGMVRDRGLAVLVVLGNIFVAWSWFGVNELGAGLHSYGFTEGVAFYLGVAMASFLAIAAAGLVPLQYWRGFSSPPPAAAK